MDEDSTLGGEAPQSGAADEDNATGKKKTLVLAVAGLVVVGVIVAVVAAVATNGDQVPVRGLQELREFSALIPDCLLSLSFILCFSSLS